MNHGTMSTIRRSGFFVALSTLILLTACLLPVGLAAAVQPPYQMPPTLRAGDLLPPDMLAGPLFQVDNQVPTDGLMGHFTLRSQWGNFVVPGKETPPSILDGTWKLPVVQRVQGSKGSHPFPPLFFVFVSQEKGCDPLLRSCSPLRDTARSSR